MKRVLSLTLYTTRVAIRRGRPSATFDVISSRQFYTPASTSNDAQEEESKTQEEEKPTSKSVNKRDNDFQSRYVPNPYIPEVKKWSPPRSKEEENPLGRELNDLLFKGRRGNPLGLGDLRNLLQKCKKPEHVRYAVRAVETYQKKGNDFAVDVASLFIRACLDGKAPLAAAHHISKFKNRIGAWITQTSLNKLVQSLADIDDHNLALKYIIEVVEMAVLKGCKPAEQTLEGVFQMSSAWASQEVYSRIEILCRERNLVDEKTIDEWKDRHPIPTDPSSVENEVTEDELDIESTQEEGDGEFDGNDEVEDTRGK